MTDVSERDVSTIQEIMVKRRKVAFGVETLSDGGTIETGLRKVEFFCLEGSEPDEFVKGSVDWGDIEVSIKKLEFSVDTINTVPGTKQDIKWFAYGK